MREKIIDTIRYLLVFILGSLVVIVVLHFLPNSNLLSIDKGVLKYDGDLIIDESGIAPSVSKLYDATVMVQNYKGSQISSTGSGFIYKKDNSFGYIMTNHHVVTGNTKVRLVMSDDSEIDAEVLGSDAYLDLAVLRIPVSNVKQVATLGNSNASSLGDTVFTIGTPIGYEYRGTVTRGTLSGKNRLVSVKVTNNEDWIMKVIQVDAAINPGNSGGPLANIEGQVIGINSLKLVEDEIEGMGFAIPIEDAMEYAESLEKGQKVERPFIGISMINASERYMLTQAGITIDSNIRSGVVIVEAVKDSPAQNAGLEKGDVINRIGNISVTNVATLKYELYKHKVGDEVKLTFIRNGKEQTTTLKLSKNNN